MIVVGDKIIWEGSPPVTYNVVEVHTDIWDKIITLIEVGNDVRINYGYNNVVEYIENKQLIHLKKGERYLRKHKF